MERAVRPQDRARARSPRKQYVGAPIALDVDRTFLAVDTLHDGIAQLSARKPRRLAALFGIIDVAVGRDGGQNLAGTSCVPAALSAPHRVYGAGISAMPAMHIAQCVL